MRIPKPVTAWQRVVLPLLLIMLLLPLLFTRKQQASGSVVTITEFSDFQCPYCKHAAGVVEQLRQSYGNNVKLVFKQMPLPMHQYAFKAAQASVCAQQQGKFWEYHDRLFAASDLTGDGMNRIAAEVGLNRDEFSQCLESQTSRAIVEKDMAEAERLGVSGTPTFFVNGKVVRGAATFATLKQEIDSAMTKRNHPLLGSSSTTDSLFVENTTSPLSIRPQVSVSKNSAASTTTASGVMLSPASINFGYQLVGTPGSEVTETVTNSRTAPLVITEISVTGRDRRNFIPAYSFTLPVTVAPGNSVVINLTFTPALPWRPGTRNARLVISEKKDSGRSDTGNDRRETSEEKDEEKDEAKDSQSVPLTGIGATCGGPLPGCSSGCANTDGDGLNDAWEFAGGIDLNNDGEIDARHDLLLPGADPNKPDVYLKYDYMVATTTSQIGTPPHSHQPPPAAIQQVVDAFASHGVNLHIDPQHDAIPEVQVTTLDPNPTIACAGPSFVTMQTLRQQHFGNRKWAYHYGVFAHNATLPDTALNGNACPIDPECLGHPDPSNSGSSELPGSSFIVAFGNDVDNGFQVGIERWAGTFMHELGHNFGLKHGSLAAPAPQTCLTNKPNYVSVMDYSYQNGINVAAAAGSTTHHSCNVDSDCPAGTRCTDDLGSAGGNVCYRTDYSREKLLDLNEASLNEPLGVGGPTGDTDIVTYCATGVGCSLSGPSYGPVDWNNDGNATETNAQGDIDNDNNTANTTLLTGNDWETANGAFLNLNFRFQCTSAFASDGGESASREQIQSSIATTELGLKQAQEQHILHPPASVSLMLNLASSNSSVPAVPPRTVQMALLGSASLDVNQVEPSSLSFHGARPSNISVQDVNSDGIPDLLLQFRRSEVRLSPNATHVRLSGWLKNSRAFVGETDSWKP